MLDNQPKKILTIFDPYTSNGILLAQKVIEVGYKVLLLGGKTKAQFEQVAIISDFISEIEFIDILDGCIDNLSVLENIRKSENLILIKSLADTKWFFDHSYDFNNEAPIFEVRQLLILLAEQNKIPIIQHDFWQCTSEILDEVITKILHSIFSENGRKMYLNTLQADIVFIEKLSYVELLVKCIKDSPEVLKSELEDSQISIRDIFRLVFDVFGAEIEFCGKGEHERGVIVDYEDDILSLSNINTSKIRLGNTIVKLNEVNYNIISAISKFEMKRDIYTSMSNINQVEIKRLIKSKVYNSLNLS